MLRRADALVLPGDGAFGATMAEIEGRGLVPLLREAVAAGTPLLGICIGMQLLFEESEEHGRHRGLGLLPGRVRRFDDSLPVPHMGWNRCAPAAHIRCSTASRTGRTSTSSTPTTATRRTDVVIATSDYGRDFAAIVGRGNVLGLQFHPEKSQAVGLRLVANFVRGRRRAEGRVIVVPAIDLRQGRVVRLHQGRAQEETVYAVDPAEVARRFEAEGAQRIHLVDLDAAMGGERAGRP